MLRKNVSSVKHVHRCYETENAKLISETRVPQIYLRTKAEARAERRASEKKGSPRTFTPYKYTLDPEFSVPSKIPSGTRLCARHAHATHTLCVKSASLGFSEGRREGKADDEPSRGG